MSFVYLVGVVRCSNGIWGRPWLALHGWKIHVRCATGPMIVFSCNVLPVTAQLEKVIVVTYTSRHDDRALWYREVLAKNGRQKRDYSLLTCIKAHRGGRGSADRLSGLPEL